MMTFKSISESAYINPGDIYIFSEDESPQYDPGPIMFMYFIRSEDEIIPAIKMEVELYLSYQINKIFGCYKISETCYEFKMECHNSDDGDIEYSIFMHRIRTVQEAIRNAYEE